MNPHTAAACVWCRKTLHGYAPPLWRKNQEKGDYYHGKSYYRRQRSRHHLQRQAGSPGTHQEVSSQGSAPAGRREQQVRVVCCLCLFRYQRWSELQWCCVLQRYPRRSQDGLHHHQPERCSGRCQGVCVRQVRRSSHSPECSGSKAARCPEGNHRAEGCYHAEHLRRSVIYI